MKHIAPKNSSHRNAAHVPTVTLDRDHLYERLGKTYTQEEFELLCFEFGSNSTMSSVPRAKDMNKNLTAKELETYDKSVEYAIDVPANHHHDLLYGRHGRACASSWIGRRRRYPS